MSDLSDVVEGCATVIQAISGLNVYDHSPMGVVPPAAFVTIDEVDYRIAMQGNSFTGILRVVIGVVSGGSTESAQKTLYDYLSPTGSRSVVKAIRDDPTLNSKVDDSDVESIENVRRDDMEGGSWEMGDVLVTFVKTVA